MSQHPRYQLAANQPAIKRSPHGLLQTADRPRVRYLRLAGHDQSDECPPSSCGSITLNIGEVEMFDVNNGVDYINISSTTVTADSNISGQGPDFAADDDISTWFGSGSIGATASLELDVGTSGPYFEDLANISVFSRCGLHR